MKRMIWRLIIYLTSTHPSNRRLNCFQSFMTTNNAPVNIYRTTPRSDILWSKGKCIYDFCHTDKNVSHRSCLPTDACTYMYQCTWFPSTLHTQCCNSDLCQPDRWKNPIIVVNYTSLILSWASFLLLRAICASKSHLFITFSHFPFSLWYLSTAALH